MELEVANSHHLSPPLQLPSHPSSPFELPPSSKFGFKVNSAPASYLLQARVNQFYLPHARNRGHDLGLIFGAHDKIAFVMLHPLSEDRVGGWDGRARFSELREVSQSPYGVQQSVGTAVGRGILLLINACSVESPLAPIVHDFFPATSDLGRRIWNRRRRRVHCWPEKGFLRISSSQSSPYYALRTLPHSLPPRSPGHGHHRPTLEYCCCCCCLA